MTDDINTAFEQFKSDNGEFIDLTITDKAGNIIFKTDNADFDDESRKNIINAWDNHEGMVKVNVGGESMRFIVLKNDPLQFAALKPGTPYQIVGTSRDDKYGFSKIENGPNLNASSVYFQKWVVDKI
ncbi:MAG: hypothetical protein GY870_04245 [archaeon]|nr:hypothetical protein [archaeon]